jgi:VWFA-related protein
LPEAREGVKEMKTRASQPATTLPPFVSKVAAVVACAAALGLVVSAQQPVFRRTVELIAVDVQVMDHDGYPVGQLPADNFHVSIEGKPRKVTSAQFIRHADTLSRTKRPAVPVQRVETAPSGPGRTIVLAVDSGSFEPLAIRNAMDAARSFIQRLEPADRLGLYIAPDGGWMEPSTERMPISVRLENLHGTKEPLNSYYNLTPHEIVDITTESQNPFSFLTRGGAIGGTVGAEFDPVLKVQQRECPDEPECPARIFAEGMGLATQIERESELSLASIESLLRVLSLVPGRKAVVLVSGGIVVSDKIEGRPDVGQAGRVLGQTAARANTTIYTVHMDMTSADIGRASKRGVGNTDLSRDRAMASNWLEEFSRAAGGKRIDVPPGGTPDFAFDTILRETSAYYLLGVEPDDADRDGRPRELKVKVDRPDTTVRNRQWVVIPPRRKSS